MIEEWKTIEGYSDYQVSNLGKIKSFKKHNGTNERILKPYKDKYGYFRVVLISNKKTTGIFVHRLVLMNFKPIDNSEDLQCNHINGIKDDNRLKNLEWCTGSENMIHAWKTELNFGATGRHRSEETKRKISNKLKGKHYYIYKLTKEDIQKIKILLKENILSQRKIAKMFEISQSHVCRINLELVCY